MPVMEKLEVALPSDVMDLARQRVEKGDYPSLDALVSEAISTLSDGRALGWSAPDELIKHLVQEALDDPRPTLSAAEVREHLSQRVRQSQQEKLARASNNGTS